MGPVGPQATAPLLDSTQVEMSPRAVEDGFVWSMQEGLWAGRALKSPSRPQTRAMGHDGCVAR
jgi:hypothetical protein